MEIKRIKWRFILAIIDEDQRKWISENFPFFYTEVDYAGLITKVILMKFTSKL